MKAGDTRRNGISSWRRQNKYRAISVDLSQSEMLLGAAGPQYRVDLAKCSANYGRANRLRPFEAGKSQIINDATVHAAFHLMSPYTLSSHETPAFARRRLRRNNTAMIGSHSSKPLQDIVKHSPGRPWQGRCASEHRRANDSWNTGCSQSHHNDWTANGDGPGPWQSNFEFPHPVQWLAKTMVHAHLQKSVTA